eukprot:9120330-Karenia_brevis.AAC.1
MLDLSALNPCRYALRHGGASEDLLTKTRSVADVKRRGLWRSDSSLRRYAKEARLLSELKKVPKPSLDYGRLVLQNLKAILLGEIPAPPPPFVNKRLRSS